MQTIQTRPEVEQRDVFPKYSKAASRGRYRVFPGGVRCACCLCGAHTYAVIRSIGISGICSVCDSRDLTPLEAPPGYLKAGRSAGGVPG